MQYRLGKRKILKRKHRKREMRRWTLQGVTLLSLSVTMPERNDFCQDPARRGRSCPAPAHSLSAAQARCPKITSLEHPRRGPNFSVKRQQDSLTAHVHREWLKYKAIVVVPNGNQTWVSAHDLTCPSHLHDEFVYLASSLPHIITHPRISTTTRFDRFDIDISLIASFTRLHSY
jgi:hypothetical protein